MRTPSRLLFLRLLLLIQVIDPPNEFPLSLSLPRLFVAGASVNHSVSLMCPGQGPSEQHHLRILNIVQNVHV